MSSSLLKRFEASRESAPVESPLDKPASIHDDAGKVVAAVEPAVPATAESSSGPGLHAPGLPAEPVTKPVDATGVAKDESADKNVVAAVKPAVPSSSAASDLPAEPVKEAKSDTAAMADDKADAEGKTVAAVQSVTPHHASEALTAVMEARTAAALEWMMEDKHGVQISVPVRSQAHHGHLADYFDKLANDPAEKAKKNHDGIPGIHSEADMHRSMADYHRKLSKGIDPANEDLDPSAAQVQPASTIVPMPDHARETEEAYRAVEEATLHHAVEEFERVQEGLESLRDRIDADNASGGLSAESAFFAHFAVESLLKRFNVEDSKTKASFESAVIVPDGKSVIDLESLDASLEAVDNTFTTFGKRAVATFFRSANLIGGSLTYSLAAKSNALGLGSLIKRAEKLRGKSAGDAKITVRRMLLPAHDDSGKNLPGEIQKVATVIEYLLRQFQTQAVADYKYNLDMVKSSVKGGLTDDTYKTILSKWKDPRRKLGDKISGSLFGNIAIFKDQSLKYKGDNSTAKAFDKIANLEYPEVAGFQAEGGRHFFKKSMREKVEIDALTPDEIIRIAQTFQLAAKAVSFWQNIVESIAADSTLVIGGAIVKSLRRRSHIRTGKMVKSEAAGDIGPEEAHALADALATSNRLRFHVGADAMWVLGHAIGAFRSAAKHSLNAIAKAAVESFDQQNSLDGVSVNETAKYEPVQMPSAGHTATEKELMAKQDSWEDQPASFQTIEDEACCESLIAEGKDLQIVTKHYALEADGAVGDEKASILKRSEATVKKWMTKVLEFFRAMWAKIQSFFGRGSKRFQELYQRARQSTSAEIQFTISEDEAKWVQNFKMPDFDKFIDWMNEVGELASNSINGRASSDPMLTKAAGSAVVPATGLPGAFTVKADGNSFTTVEEPARSSSWEGRVHRMHKVELEDFLKKAAGTAERIEKISDVQLRELNRRKDAMEDINGSNAYVQHLVTTLVSFGSFMLKGVSIVHRWENEVIKVINRSLDRDPKKGTAATEAFEDHAIDFDEAASACESLIEEVGEINILSQHYATEDEASGEAKPRPGMLERIKALIAKMGEFFRSVWKRIVQFVTQQGNRLKDWAAQVRKHHFTKVTVKITGSEDAYINDMKLPNLTPFYEFMDEVATTGDAVATRVEATRDRHSASKSPESTIGKAYRAASDMVTSHAATGNFSGLHVDTPIPAEGLVGAFKLSNDQGKLVETQVAKKIGPDREYTVTGSSLASFIDGAAKLISKAEARVKAFEMKSDADWKRAKAAADSLDGTYYGAFDLKPYGETARYLMKAFSVLQSWARAVSMFAEKCIKGAGEKLRKSDRDNIADATFTAATEARTDLPYWYHPAEA